MAKWAVEYYEQQDGTQPAEGYEIALKRDHPKLAGKQRRVFVGVLEHGRKLGGGLIEPLYGGYSNLWEARTIFESWLAREFFAWDGNTAILLHGYVKRVGREASTSEMDTAQTYRNDYLQTHRISLEVPEAAPSGESSRAAPQSPKPPSKRKKGKEKGETR